MKKIITAILLGLGLAVAVGGAAHATTAPYVLVLWVQDDRSSLFPQTFVSSQEQEDLSLDGLDSLAVDGCYQADIYNNDAITAALLAEGHLYGAENPDESWPGDGSYQSTYSKVWCVTPEPPAAANPGGSIVATCGAATVTLTNSLDGVPSRLTASAVVYVDGEFHEALTAEAGVDAVNAVPITFAEDSGQHTVMLRTGAAFGDELIAEATVESDCVLPPVVEPPVVEPPVIEPPIVEPPVVEPPVVEPPVVTPPMVVPPVVEPPAVVTPLPVVAAVQPEPAVLASTGVSSVGPPLVGLLILLIGAIITLSVRILRRGA